MQWDHDQKHREAVTRKLEKIQGLVALLDTWEKKPQDNDAYRKYLGELRQKLHSARTQYKAMAIVKDAIEMPFARAVKQPALNVLLRRAGVKDALGC